MGNSVQGIILLLVCGVFYAVTDEVKSVYEGDSVTLQTDTVIKKDEKILWKHIKKGSFILLVEMIEHKIEYDDSIDERIRNRLQILDTQTGDLTIKNMRIKHTGVYQAEIQTGTGTSHKNFSVTVKESPRYTDAGVCVVKSVSVMEGESVTLHTDEQTQKGDLILWRFGDKNLLIAKGDMEDNEISLYDDDYGRFSGRLKLDKSGNLTITDIRTSNAGVYNLKIISNRETKYNTFSVSLSGGGLSAGYIALICILVLTALVGVLAVLWFWYRRSQLKVQEIFVYEGESLTLSTAGIKLFRLPDVIEWSYGDNEVIANINRKDNTFPTYDGADGKFNGTLNLNHQTGDLTISKIKIKHSGLYKVKGTPWPLSKICTSYRQFNVIVTDRIVQVKSGDPVTLHTDVKEIQKDDLILWTCGDGDTHIAKFIGGTQNPVFYDYRYIDDRFKKRLNINPQTGDLTINNITPKHCGVYRVLICSNKKSTYKRFKVSIIVPAEKGKSVNLEPKGEIQKGDRVEWNFRDDPSKRTSYDKITLVTGMNGDDSKTSYTVDKRFRDRLKMDAQTGDLLIIDIRETDEGIYTLKLINTNGKNIQWIFSVVINSTRTNRNEPAAAEDHLLNEEAV